jgi:hypothetical protein
MQDVWTPFFHTDQPLLNTIFFQPIDPNSVAMKYGLVVAWPDSA